MSTPTFMVKSKRLSSTSPSNRRYCRVCSLYHVYREPFRALASGWNFSLGLPLMRRQQDVAQKGWERGAGKHATAAEELPRDLKNTFTLIPPWQVNFRTCEKQSFNDTASLGAFHHSSSSPGSCDVCPHLPQAPASAAPPPSAHRWTHPGNKMNCNRLF